MALIRGVASAKSGFEFSIQPEKNPVEAGDPIWLIIRLRNTTSGRLVYGRSSGVHAQEEIDYDFTVRNLQDAAPLRESLSSVPTTLFYEREVLPYKRSAIRPPYIYIRVEPGEVAEQRILLSRMYDMTLVGSYRITARRAVPMLLPKGGFDPAVLTEIASNEVIVELTPRK